MTILALCFNTGINALRMTIPVSPLALVPYSRKPGRADHHKLSSLSEFVQRLMRMEHTEMVSMLAHVIIN